MRVGGRMGLLGSVLVLALLFATVPSRASQTPIRSLTTRQELNAAAGPGGSIVFIKNHDVWLARPDGSGAYAVTTRGTQAQPYESPSQANDGTIVAVRKTVETTDGVTRTPRRLHRMNRYGRLLNPPVETVDPENSFYVGPLGAQVSPNGERVAYFYFYNGPIGGGTTDPQVAYSYSDRDTPPGEISSSVTGLTPSWMDNTFVMLFLPPQYTPHVAVDEAGGTGYVPWFSTDQADSLAQGEVSPNGTRLAAVGTTGEVQEIILFEITQPFPAPPEGRCRFTGPSGYFQDPTFSSDGSALAWEEGNGIHVMTGLTLTPCAGNYSGTPTLVGSDPDWGPAAAIRPLSLAVRLASPQSLSSLLAGVKPRVTCSRACSFTSSLIADAATSRRFNLGTSATIVGSARGSLGASGSKTVTINLKDSARARLRGARTAFDLKLKVVGTAGGSKDVASKTIKIAP